MSLRLEHFNAVSGIEQASINSELAHGVIDLEPADAVPTVGNELDLQETYDKQRDTAVSANNADPSDLGRIATAGAATNTQDKNSQQKKKEEDQRRLLNFIVMQNQQMSDFLNDRADLYNEWADKLDTEAEKLLQSSEEKYQLADELEDIQKDCKSNLTENGTLNSENRQRAKEKLKEAQEKLGLDPNIVALMTDKDLVLALDQKKQDTRMSALQDHEKAHKCEKTAKTARERAEEINVVNEAIEKNDNLSNAEKIEARAEIIKSHEDKDLREEIGRLDLNDEEIRRELDTQNKEQQKLMAAIEPEQEIVKHNAAMENKF